MNIEINAHDLAEVASRQFCSPGFCTDIDSRDEIFAFLAAHHVTKEKPVRAYFDSGHNAFVSLIRVLHDLGRSLGSTSHILEFACGYGRVTRHIVRALSPSRIDVSDVVAEAVAFQRSTFNVRGFVSHQDPDQCPFPAKYDVIFVASLFSHLPKGLWRPWLRKLHGRLAPDGVLIFSVHGPKCVPAGQAIGPEGFLYFRSSESKVLDGEIYGTTYVSKEFVDRSALDISGREPIAFYQQGMWNYQDVYAIGNSARLEAILLSKR